MIKDILIVGGGSAGWLAAGMLASTVKNKVGYSLSVTVVESPDVGTIGVGEGTWPTMRTTLQRIGISEADFLSACSASFKQGSKFIGWRNGSLSDWYDHPFTLPVGGSNGSIASVWRDKFSDRSFSEAVSVQGAISQQGLAPKQITTPEYAGVLNYGYHLDAEKLGEVLRKHCVENLEVKHFSNHVSEVIPADDGDIHGVRLASGDVLTADFFIDCTGLKSLLLGEHLKVNFNDKSRFLFNDMALAVRVPYGSPNDEIASMTEATAQKAGWIWDIGLSSRRGVGYVFSSAHTSKESACDDLMAYISRRYGKQAVSHLEPRALKISAGYREEIWCRNCLAIGMSAGFIEPLEASALAMIELSAKMLCAELPMTKETMPISAKRFNRVFQYRWQKIIEFLKLHYVLTEREDTEYWKDAKCKSTTPIEVEDMLSLWKWRQPTLNDFSMVEEVFPYPSFQYILYGMKASKYYEALKVDASEAELADHAIRNNINSLRKYERSLLKNRTLLNLIGERGLPTV